MRSNWALLVTVPLGWLAACSSSSRDGFADYGDAAPSGDDSGGGRGDGSGGQGGTYGQLFSGEAGKRPTSTGPCKGGYYQGMFTGLYTSHLTGVGVPIPVAGDVQLTLNQEGASGMQCTIDGEFQDCSTVFSLQNGTITGVADALNIGDASAGGFPYFCTMTGTLDCNTKKLVHGWIQCTYCVGPLADGGMACSLLNGVAGTDGVGGHFAGPLTADYDVSALAFVNGSWNGAEALAGNDGGSPGPEGGPVSSYLSDSGLYLGPGNFGGSGQWNAAYTADH
jgi:hypothetical protein